MQALSVDLLGLCLPSNRQRCIMTAVASHYRDTLQELLDAAKAHSMKRVKWRGRLLTVHVKMNLPHTARLLWTSCGTTKEVRIALQSLDSSGQRLDGTVNFDIQGLTYDTFVHRKGKVKQSARSDNCAALYLLHHAVKFQLTAADGKRLPNGKADLFLRFSTQRSVFDHVLTIIQPRAVREEYAIATPNEE